jgi:multidrug efflux pump subunit AcrA (membrane-fusion protein)
MLRPEDNESDVLRSGMTASAQFVVYRKDQALVLPSWIADGQQNTTVPLLTRARPGENSGPGAVKGAPEGIVKRDVKVGRSNGEKIEILEGLTKEDVVVYRPVKISTEGPKSPLGIFDGKKRGK